MKTLIHFLIIYLLLTSIFIKATTQNIPDFLVNDHASIDGSEQSTPDIDGDGQGNYVLTWRDDRSGYFSAIYAQIYHNDTTPFGENFKVGDDGETSTRYNPAIAVDQNLNFVITWLDRRSGQWDVYAQQFSNTGIPPGNTFKVNNEPGDEEQEQPCVAIDNSGNFVITWSDEKNGDWDIYGQRYAADGTALGENFRINDDTGNELQYWPCCNCDKNGNLLVSWIDQRYNEDYEIYAQRYLPDGTPVGGNFKVNSDTEQAFQLRPDISFDDSGNFIITWEDQRSGEWDVYAQRYFSDGSTLGDNFKVNDDAPDSYQRNASITSDENGNFVICWQDSRDDYQDIYAQRFSNNATPIGTNFKVNTDTTNTYQYYSEITGDASGNFMIAWEDHRNGYNGDIFKQFYLNDGNTLGSNKKINDDEGSENQQYPAIAVDGNENFIVAWVDLREGDENIYAQRFSGDGTALGSNFKVNNDNLPFITQWEPDVAADAVGNFVIAWVDYRSGYDGDIYAQRYASDGTPLDSNFLVNYLGANMHYCPEVVYSPNGDFIISWGDAEDGGEDKMQNSKLNPEHIFEDSSEKEIKTGEPDIWAQRFSGNGTALGENFKVNDDTAWNYQQYPAIAVGFDGNFIITWEDDRNGDWDIFYQRYSWDGATIGVNTKVEDATFSEHQRNPAIAIGFYGCFTIAWSDKRNGDYDVYAQHFYPDGYPMGNNFRVNTDTSNSHQSYPSIASESSGNFIINWTDSHNGDDDVYGQRFWSDVNTFGIYGHNYCITESSEFRQNRPAVALHNNRIFTTWQDNQSEQFGWDIWASVCNWGHWVGVENATVDDSESVFTLYQNYPNPFNTTTNIKFSLPENAKIKIEIFNYLGVLQKILLDKTMESGTHQIECSAGDLLPGIYYYRITVEEFRKTRIYTQAKMMVIL